jgi:DNA-binding transcriptional LysR family regulator
MNWPADLQLAQLQLFIRLADAGSLSAAARQMHLTPAAASASLKRLEASLAVRLVERSTRSMRLTPEGELLRDHAQRALGVLDDARSLLGAQREELAGEVHLASPLDLGRTVLSPMLSPFLARHPKLRLVLHLSDAVHDLMRERVDLAVRYGVLQDSSLVVRPLLETRRVLVASPGYLAAHGHPVHPDDLARHNCLVLNLKSRPEIRWTFHRGTETVQVKANGNRVADDGGLVREWAVAGLGIAFKAGLDVLADLKAGRLVRVMPAWHGDTTPVQAILPTQRHLPLRVRRLLDELVLQFARVDDTTSNDNSGSAPPD